MALVLSMKACEDFYVGAEHLTVGRVDKFGDFELVRKRDNKTFLITEFESVEIAPDIFVSAGERKQIGVARVAIEAPQDMLILRGETYRAQTVKMVIS